MPSPLRYALPLLLALAGGALLVPGPALAAGTMPNVVGQPADQALAKLEALGLNVRVITIAGKAPDVVDWQDPPEGQPVEAGDEVVVHIGVRAFVKTISPSVVGMTEEEAWLALEETYFVEVEYVPGPRRQDGRVLAQDPPAGSQIPYRGVFKVKVVRNAVSVPLVVGQTEAEARRLLEEAGLPVNVSYMRSGNAAAGTVIGQEPQGGSTLLPGGVVELRVVGNPGGNGRTPPRGGQALLVPDIIGMGMQEAEELLLSLGLTPHMHLAPAGGQPDWTVVSQEIAPNTRVAPGSDVGYVVAKPAQLPSSLRIPNLVGADEQGSQEVLAHMGLNVTVRREVSALAAGTVIGQTPAPGTFVQPGSAVELRVATPRAGGVMVQQVAVPSVIGMTVTEARMALVGVGLAWTLERGLAGDRPVERVYEQDPQPGQNVAAGTQVTFYLPLRAQVPDLAGLTRLNALEALQRAGLQGLAVRVGPNTNQSLTEVIWQEVPTGAVIARGSLVQFRFQEVAPRTPLLTVPDVLGLTREDAQARLQAAGFGVSLRAISIGAGNTEVVSQSPRAGSRQIAGSTVLVTYRFVGSSIRVTSVPHVIGRSHESARQVLEAAGFGVAFVAKGPIHGGVKTEVIAQNPLAGTLRPLGSIVTLTYHSVGGGRLLPGPTNPALLRVPNVVGLSVQDAVGRLRAAGLNGAPTGFGRYVRAQSPGAGMLVPKGTTVRLSVRR